MFSWSKIPRAHKSPPSLHSLLTSQFSRRQVYLTQYMLLTHAHDLLFLQPRAVRLQFPFSALSFLSCLFLKMNKSCICLGVNLMVHDLSLHRVHCTEYAPFLQFACSFDLYTNKCCSYAVDSHIYIIRSHRWY